MEPGHFVTLRAAYLRAAQDAIRQYHADALVNGLSFDRHDEQFAVEAFAGRIVVAGEMLRTDPTGRTEIPNWTCVLAALPDFPERLDRAVRAEACELVSEVPDARGMIGDYAGRSRPNPIENLRRP